MSPHDHDLLEGGACYEVPQSIQGGGGHNLRYLHHYFHVVQIHSISCTIMARLASLTDSKTPKSRVVVITLERSSQTRASTALTDVINIA